MQQPLNPSQVQPQRNLDVSSNKKDQEIDQIDQPNNDPQINDFRLNENEEQTPNELSLDASQINLQIVKILQQMQIENRIPDGKSDLSQKTTALLTSNKIDWKMISVLILISVTLSSAFSVGICCTLIKYRIIAINPIDNPLNEEVLRGVSEIAPFPAQTQKQTPNTQHVSPFDGGWIYFSDPRQVFYFSFNNVNQNVFDFSETIPKTQNIKYIKLIIYNTAGNIVQRPSYRYWIKTRVINKNKQWVHYNFGHRYWQDAISFNSEEVIVPCSDTREIRFKTTNTQINAQLSYFITGYLPQLPA